MATLDEQILTSFDPEGDVPVLPIAILLAGLAEAPRRDFVIG